MEGESELDSPSSTKLLTFAELADELCPHYMSLGVSCNDYWHGDYTQLQFYVKARELDNERKNQELWLQGLYVYHAFNVVTANAFKKRSDQPEKYMDKPIPLTAPTEREKGDAAERARQKIIEDLTRWGSAWEQRQK